MTELPSEGFRFTGVTARRGLSMIVNEAELSTAGLEVERSWQDAGTAWGGVIISAGSRRLRDIDAQAAFNARRFGVATVKPDLVAAIDGRASELGLEAHYTDIRLTEGDPRAGGRSGGA